MAFAGFLDALVKPCVSFFASLSDRSVHGEYRITRPKVAEGGFGFVHQGATMNGRTVALKEVRCEGAVEDVEREAAAHAAFGGSEAPGALPRRRGSSTCGYVMPLLDCIWEARDGKRAVDSGGEGIARAWLVFPFYAQGSAQDALNASLVMADGAPTTVVDGGLPTRTVLRLGLGLCEALKALHAYAGPPVPALGGGGPFSHRDVNPRNLMIDDAGRAVLIDLGSVASGDIDIRTRADALRLQEEAATRSSMGYRAPELWDPPTGTKVSTASDVFAVGATLYALAYGVSPFESVVCTAPAPLPSGGRSAQPPPSPCRRRLALPLKFDACSATKVLAAVAFPDGPAAVAAAVAASGGVAAAGGDNANSDGSSSGVGDWGEENERGPMPQAFRDLVAACLSLDPSTRPDVGAVAAALADLLSGGGEGGSGGAAAVPAKAPSSAQRGSGRSKQPRAMPATLTAAASGAEEVEDEDEEASEAQPALP